MKQDRRLTIDAELRAQTPQSETPEDGPAENSADPQPKDSQTSKGKTISGYAIVWNSPSKDLGGFTEVVTPKPLMVSIYQTFLCLITTTTLKC